MGLIHLLKRMSEERRGEVQQTDSENEAEKQRVQEIARGFIDREVGVDGDISSDTSVHTSDESLGSDTSSSSPHKRKLDFSSEEEEHPRKKRKMSKKRFIKKSDEESSDSDIWEYVNPYLDHPTMSFGKPEKKHWMAKVKWLMSESSETDISDVLCNDLPVEAISMTGEEHDSELIDVPQYVWDETEGECDEQLETEQLIDLINEVVQEESYELAVEEEIDSAMEICQNDGTTEYAKKEQDNQKKVTFHQYTYIRYIQNKSARKDVNLLKINCRNRRLSRPENDRYNMYWEYQAKLYDAIVADYYLNM